jgi:TorA maturation chaperone TorD
VDARYRQWGLVVHEQVDHAGAELEFLAFLLALETPESLAAADAFLKDHASRWIPRWADDVGRESHLGFYRIVGKLAATIFRENQRMAGTPKDSHDPPGMRECSDAPTQVR